jgi:hypothetical protein
MRRQANAGVQPLGKRSMRLGPGFRRDDGSDVVQKNVHVRFVPGLPPMHA